MVFSMKSPDIIAEAKCEDFPHPIKCNVCVMAIHKTTDHRHYWRATKDGFKPISVHIPCARSWSVGAPEQ